MENTEEPKPTHREGGPRMSTGWRTPTEQIADIILRDVEQAPMSYISDEGERARHTAHHIRLIAELETRNRITAVLDGLEAVARNGHRTATEAVAARTTGLDMGSAAYSHGRAAAFADVLAAVEAAKAAVLNPARGKPAGRTRAEAAQDFAETIINQPTAGDTK